MLLLCYLHVVIQLVGCTTIFRYYSHTRTLEYWTNHQQTFKLFNKSEHITYDTLVDKLVWQQVFTIMTYRNVDIGNYTLKSQQSSIPLNIEVNTQVNSQCHIDNTLNLMKSTNLFSIVYATYGICDNMITLATTDITKSTYYDYQLHEAQKVYVHHHDYISTGNVSYRIIWANKQLQFSNYTLIYAGQYVSQVLHYPQKAVISQIVKENKLYLVPFMVDNKPVRIVHIFQQLNNIQLLKIIVQCAPRDGYLMVSVSLFQFVPTGRQTVVSGISPTDCISLIFPNKIIWMLAEKCNTEIVAQSIFDVLLKMNDKEIIILRQPLCSTSMCYGKEHSQSYQSLMKRLKVRLPESVLRDFRGFADRLEIGRVIEWEQRAVFKEKVKFVEDLHETVAETEKKWQGMYKNVHNFWQSIDDFLKRQAMLNTELVSALWGCFICFILGSVVWWLRHIEKSKK